MNYIPGLEDWLSKNCVFRDYENAETDPDLAAFNHKKAAAKARTMLRNKLEKQLLNLIKDVSAEPEVTDKLILP